MLELVGLDGKQTVGAAHVDFPVEGHDGLYLACQTVLGQEIAIDRRQFDGEDAMQGGSPQYAVTVVDDVGHLIGTETVGLGDAIEVMAEAVGNDQSMVFPDLHLQSSVERNRLCDIFKNDLFFTSLNGLK